MKQTITISAFMIITLTLLTACSPSEGVYANLQDNLCGTQPACCGEYTEEQSRYAAIYKAALDNQNSELCEQLPADDSLIADCAGSKGYVIIYDRQDCLEQLS